AQDHHHRRGREHQGLQHHDEVHHRQPQEGLDDGHDPRERRGGHGRQGLRGQREESRAMSCRRTTRARLAASLLLSAAAVGGLCAQEAEAGQGDASQPSLDLSGDHEFRFALPAGSDSWATGYAGTMKYPELVSDLGIKAGQGPVSVVGSWEITSSSQGGPANLESYSLQDLESYIAWS